MLLNNWLKRVVVVSLDLVLLNFGVVGSAVAQSQTDPVPVSMVVSRSDEPLTLSQAVEIALTRNPLTRVTAAGRELADAQLAGARANRWPLLQASESVTTSNNPVFVFGSLLEQGRFGANNFLLSSLNNPDALTNFRGGLSVRVPLFDQRQTSARIAVAKLGQQQADQQAQLVAQQIRFQVLKSYYGGQLGAERPAIGAEP